MSESLRARLDGFLGTLNREQRDAVAAPEGPALVFAGAGSGKTRVLTGRAFYLIARERVGPQAIAVMTFTNKAAEELRERLRTYLGAREDLPWAGTFHSFCARLLRRYGGGIGLDPSFTIYDTSDTEQLLAEVLHEHRISRDELAPSLLRAWISLLKNGGALSGRHPFHRKVEELWRDYDARLRAAQAVDFDDLLRLPLELMEKDASLRERLQHTYDHVLIDEFQDTNRPQYDLARVLALPQNNLFVVGDDDQSIYSWRGADFRNILRFEADLPGARVFRLEQNYRSTQAILDVANDVIAQNRQRADKRLWTSRKGGDKVTIRQTSRAIDEAHEVVGEILHLARTQSVRYKDMAVLFRTNALSRQFEDVLISQAVPYSVVGGIRFYERKEIKDLLAYLRVVMNPRDDQAWRRVLRVPPKGIGDVTLEHLNDAARQSECSIGEVILKLDEHEELPPAARRKLEGVSKRITTLRAEVQDADLVEAVQKTLDQSGLLPYYEAEADGDEEDRAANLQQLVDAARDRSRENPGCTLADFLAEIALVADIDDYDQSPDRVTLMTLHAAKGLEFRVVFIAGLEDNVLPHERNSESAAGLEEERRLFYVGCTRAQDRLFLTYAQERAVRGSVRFQSPSRFLYDIAAEHRRGWTLPGRMRLSGEDELSEAEERTPLRERSRAHPATSISCNHVVPYKIGDVVEHPVFGVGVVIAKSGDASDLKVRVAFQGMGAKLLAVKFAPLKKVSSEGGS